MTWRYCFLVCDAQGGPGPCPGSTSHVRLGVYSTGGALLTSKYLHVTTHRTAYSLSFRKRSAYSSIPTCIREQRLWLPFPYKTSHRFSDSMKPRTASCFSRVPHTNPKPSRLSRLGSPKGAAPRMHAAPISLLPPSIQQTSSREPSLEIQTRYRHSWTTHSTLQESIQSFT